jgi:hypothetical protein
MTASWRLILLALAAALVAATLAPAPSLAAEDKPTAHDSYDDAQDAFLGGPDPPCMLPCVVVLWLVVLVVTAALLAIGAVAAGFLLVAGLALMALGAVLAGYLMLQGAGLLAALAILPGLLVVVWVALRRPTRTV